MAILNYNLSTNLQGLLNEISSLRQKILLSSIAPNVELRLRWEAQLSKIYWALSLSNSPISKADMARLIAYPSKKRLNEFEKEVIFYKNALDYIKQNWLLSDKTVTFKTVKVLAPGLDLEKKRKDIEYLLNYLQTGTENPVIQAGIAQIQFDEKVAGLISTLFLYKNGYDMRGMLVIEEFMRSDLIGLRTARESVLKNNNLTVWLEYYAYGITVQLKKALEIIGEERFKSQLPSHFWKLNERQKKIMTLMDNPEIKMTNKEVQKIFKISQITASRDLSRMATLGLIFARGKGRSVFYTKV